jgi:hypothetical protein
MAYKAAHIITESLSSIGVRRVYGIVGDTLNGFTSSVRRRLAWVHTRHEEAAALRQQPRVTSQASSPCVLAVVDPGISI